MCLLPDQIRGVEKKWRDTYSKPVELQPRVGIKFIYLGYYYSSPKGTIQLLTYTSSNLLDEYKKDLKEFLNSFIVLE